MTDFDQKIIAAIAAQKLVPKHVFYFLAKRSIFWGLAILAIVLGAVNFAMIEFVITDYFKTRWRILDNVHYNEILVGLPLLWLTVGFLLAGSAAVGLRHTRRGYRIKNWQLATGAILVSLALGTLLHATDAGLRLHNYLSTQSAFYHRLTYVPFAEWSKPDQGKLGGTVVAEIDGDTIQLIDFTNKKWIIDISKAEISFDATLIEEGDIAIQGKRTGENTFHAKVISEFD